MVFGCNNNVLVQTWITNTAYSGPVLYLNEPDNGTASGGSACSPATAVTSLSEFISWKNTYKQQTARDIDIIFGGVYFGPDMNWARVYPNNRLWIEEFYFQWKKSHQNNPDISGFHFHVYPWNPAILDKEGILTHLKRRMEGGYDPVYNQTFMGWNQWIAQNSWVKGTKGELWITEIGVLDDRVSKQTTDYILQNMIPYLEGQSQITRVAWFTHAIKSTVRSFDQTSLMDPNNTSQTSTWGVYKKLCMDQKYCISSIRITPTPSLTLSTPTPTSSPTLPSPTLQPPTITPIPTSQPQVCITKYKGDADCKKDTNNNSVNLLDYAIWYSEFIHDCAADRLRGCGVDSDGDGNSMDANFNYPGTSHIMTDTIISSFDYAVWIQGFITQ